MACKPRQSLDFNLTSNLCLDGTYCISPLNSNIIELKLPQERWPSGVRSRMHA